MSTFDTRVSFWRLGSLPDNVLSFVWNDRPENDAFFLALQDDGRSRLDREIGKPRARALWQGEPVEVWIGSAANAGDLTGQTRYLARRQGEALNILQIRFDKPIADASTAADGTDYSAEYSVVRETGALWFTGDKLLLYADVPKVATRWARSVRQDVSLIGIQIEEGTTLAQRTATVETRFDAGIRLADAVRFEDGSGLDRFYSITDSQEDRRAGRMRFSLVAFGV